LTPEAIGTKFVTSLKKLYMKNYSKQQYSGNENGWHEPVVKLGNYAMQDSHVEELNSHFNSTGTFYEETDDMPDEFERDVVDVQTGDTEPNLVYKDGKLVKADKKGDSFVNNTIPYVHTDGGNPANQKGDEIDAKSNGNDVLTNVKKAKAEPKPKKVKEVKA
jgi:hypothetical protein